MINSTPVRNFVILLSCLCPLSSLADLGDPSELTSISLPQYYSPAKRAGSGPTMNLRLDEIATPKGSERGEVKDFILNLDTGYIAFIVGTFNHLPHWKDQFFLIPWERARLASETENFALASDEITLEKTFHFSPVAWRTQPFSSWILHADRYGKEKHGLSARAETTPPPTYAKASDMLGLPVQTPTRKTMGMITELLIAPDSGEIASVVLSVEMEQPESKKTFFALPWGVLQVSAKQHFLNIEKEQSHPSQISKDFCDTIFSDHPIAHCQPKRIYRKAISDN